MKAYGLTDTVFGEQPDWAFKYIEFELKRIDGILCWEATKYLFSCKDMSNHIYLNRRLIRLGKSPSSALWYFFEESDLAN